MTEQLAELLQAGIKQLQLDIATETQNKLLKYVELLIKWNKTYNLTAITKPREIVIKHILDSLSVTKFIHGKRVLDVGSGAGLPGIPLALALPEKEFVLLDSKSKKTRFLNFAVLDIQLPNITVVQERVEKFQPKQKFDTIITRAFSKLNDMIAGTKHLYNASGMLLAMKGKYPEAELQELNFPIEIHNLTVPFLAEERNLVCIKEINSG